MNRRLFIFVIILMLVSLSGIILLQLFWIRNAISIREEYFNKNVNLALRETARRLEKNENYKQLGKQLTKFYIPGADSFVEDEEDSTVQSMKNGYYYNVSSSTDKDIVMSVWTDDGGNSHKIIEYKHDISIDSIKRSVARVKANVEIDSLSQFLTHDLVLVDGKSDTIIKGGDTLLQSLANNQYMIVRKARDLNEAFIELAYEIESSPPPIEERVDTSMLPGLVASSLFNKGINQDFEYGILHIDSMKNVPLSSEGFDPERMQQEYMVGIFPNELADESNFLVLQFPHRNMHLIRSMAGILGGSLLLTLIILATFAITIFMILRQKKLSDIKSDFINNMTHEFKTPIATISLAVDSINSPKIISNSEEVRYYTGIIREENQRMNTQVENVLRMSLLDKHDLEFNIIHTDLNEVISAAVSKVKLLLKEREGEIRVHLDADDPVVPVDPDHLTNAILNLLDNAIKYSEDKPEIDISCTDVPEGIMISVSDKGMGMTKEVVHRIFDRFYRKPSGNIHNIKGFGLGLSYVKAIIDAFGGIIRVRSEAGKGSIFEIIFPKKNKTWEQ